MSQTTALPVRAEANKKRTQHSKKQAEEKQAQPITELSASPATLDMNSLTMGFNDRHYRVRGFEKNRSQAIMKINLLVQRFDDYYVDTFDLYQARPRNSFIKNASEQMYVEQAAIRKDLGKILVELEQLQAQQLAVELKQNEPEEVVLSAEEEAAALELLNDPNLIERITDDFAACGLIGEENNQLLGYLAATSRLLPSPLAILIQSSSAAGKTSLMDAVLAMMPSESQVKYSAMTSQSLFYMEDAKLKHKILAISEEEGVRQASYALKLLQSEGTLTIATTGRNEDTGQSVTEERSVAGPVMLFMTTTAYDVDPELENRGITLTVNETSDQTAAIHHQQRVGQTLDGLIARENSNAIHALHQNGQRLLKPIKVVNPHATLLSFRHDQTRCRRDNAKYLGLIQTITLLHQYQREVKTVEVGGEVIEFIESTASDIELANRLTERAFGNVYRDLPEKTEQLLMLIAAEATSYCQSQQIPPREYRFTRKEIRGWLQQAGVVVGATSLHRQLRELESRELLLNQRRAGSGYTKQYQLNYSIEADGPISELSIGLAEVSVG